MLLEPHGPNMDCITTFRPLLHPHTHTHTHTHTLSLSPSFPVAVGITNHIHHPSLLIHIFSYQGCSLDIITFSLILKFLCRHPSSAFIWWNPQCVLPRAQLSVHHTDPSLTHSFMCNASICLFSLKYTFISCHKIWWDDGVTLLGKCDVCTFKEKVCLVSQGGSGVEVEELLITEVASSQDHWIRITQCTLPVCTMLVH
jgi:hypothetical protein